MESSEFSVTLVLLFPNGESVAVMFLLWMMPSPSGVPPPLRAPQLLWLQGILSGPRGSEAALKLTETASLVWGISACFCFSLSRV